MRSYKQNKKISIRTRKTSEGINSIEFINEKGKLLSTTISDDIMSQVYDLTESILQNKGVVYFREGSVFKAFDMDAVMDAQKEANRILFDKGVITQAMIEKEMKYVGLL